MLLCGCTKSPDIADAAVEQDNDDSAVAAVDADSADNDDDSAILY